MTPCYELDCTDCSFRTEVYGEFPEAIAEAAAHRAQQDAGPTDHFVNLHRRG